MEQKKIWDYFQTDGINSFAGNSKRLNFIADKISNKENVVLNIGVGNGFLEALLQKNHKKVHSLDPSPAAVLGLKESLGLSDAAVKVGYSQEIPFPDSYFDVVIMSEVIEHLDEEILSKTLQEVRRVIRPGGRFIGTVPADENLKESLCVCPKCSNIFHRWGHIQDFNEERLKNILSIQFDDCLVSRHFFGDWRLVNWKGKLGYLMKTLTRTFGSKGGDETFFFIARNSK